MIEVTGLSQRYGSKLAVDDVSFTVPSGAVTGLLGPNGAGKSTTMRAIVGLDRPTKGDATIDGVAYTRQPAPMRTLGALLDPTTVHPGRKARTYLRALAASNGIAATRVDEVIGVTGLTEVAGGRISTYSLGMRQRLGIAAALLGDPGTLIFDEPVNGLDPDGVHWVRRLMRSLADDGRTVLVSSHLMSEMALTADRVVVMGRGRLVTEGSVHEIVARSTGTSVLVRSPRASDLAGVLTAAGATVAPGQDGALTVTGLDAARIGEAAAAQGIVLHELSPQSGSLEDAFLSLTRDSREFVAGQNQQGAA